MASIIFDLRTIISRCVNPARFESGIQRI